MVKSTLEANGINASVSADDAGGARPDVGFASGGAKLFVLDVNAERALKLLACEEGPVSHAATVGNSADKEVIVECEECGKPTSFHAERRGKIETCPYCHAYVDVPD